MDGDATFSGTCNSRVSCPTPSALNAVQPLFESRETHHIDAALLEVQSAIVNPRPNATGGTTDGGRGQYREYRYVTLDRIIDIAQDVLSQNKIIVRNTLIHNGRTYDVLTQLRHVDSGQYIGTSFPTTLERGDHRALAAAQTLGRRYNLPMLLNIATEQDTDDGSGRPDDMRAAQDAPTEIRGGISNASAPAVRHWLEFGEWCTKEYTPALALSLLKAWHTHGESYNLIVETRPDRLIPAIRKVVLVAYGSAFASAWEGIFACKSIDDLDAFRVRYDTELKADIEKLRAEHKSAVSYLTQILIVQAKRIEQNVQIAAEVEAVEIAAKAPAPPEPIKIADEAYQLIDELGEPASDEICDPMVFARAYSNLYLATAPEDRAQLQEWNEAALHWVGFHAEAAKTLEDKILPPRDTVVIPACDVTEPAGALIIDDPVAFDHLDPSDREKAITWFETFEERPPSDAVVIYSRVQDIDDPTPTVDEAKERLAAAADRPRPWLTPEGIAVMADAPTEDLGPTEGWDNAPLRVRAPVQVPVKRSGTPNLAAYIEALEQDIASVCDQPSMVAWLRANEPIYMADGFPLGARTRAIKLATMRRLVLGVDAEESGS